MMTKKTFIKVSSHLFILVLFLFPFFAVHADPSATGAITPPSTIKIDIKNPVKCDPACNTLISLITLFIDRIAMPIAAVAVVVWIIWAGFSYLLAQGNEKKLQEAHQRLLWSLIGAGILLGAAGISQVVQKTIEGITAS